MSKLELYGRNYVVFDATNKEHRKWFAEFNKSLSWGHCPVRFVIDNDHGDLVTMIQRSLIQYYVDKEFKTGTFQKRLTPDQKGVKIKT
jgi:hypothetical protein